MKKEIGAAKHTLCAKQKINNVCGYYKRVEKMSLSL